MNTTQYYEYMENIQKVSFAIYTLPANIVLPEHTGKGT